MIVQKNFIADCITRQKCLVNGVLFIVVLLRHMIFPLQLLIGQLVQQNDRTKLLRIPHQHQFPSTNDWDQRYGHVALTGLIHDCHIKDRFRFSKPMCGNAGGNHNGKYLLELFHIFRLSQVFAESGCLPIRILILIKNLS